MTCLKKNNFSGTLGELTQAARILGYETVSDMLYIMYVEKELSSREMSRLLGFSVGCIIKKLNVLCKVRNSGRRRGSIYISAEQVDELVRLKEEGLSYPDAMRALHIICSESLVRLLCRRRRAELGLPKLPRGGNRSHIKVNEAMIKSFPIEVWP